MNASFRHEDSATFPARTAGSARIRARHGRRRRRILGIVLVTGMTAAGAAIATAADGEPGGLAALGFGSKPAGVPAAPLPPVAAEPAGSDASPMIRPATTAGQPAAPKTAPERLSLWSPLQALGLMPAPKPQPAAAAASAPRVAAAKQRPTARASAGEQVGRFDPDFGTAAYVVSDGQAAAESLRPRSQAWDGQPSAGAAQPLPGGLVQDGGLDEPEQSVSVSDEPVSLVGWLAGQYAGHGDGGGYCPDVLQRNPCCKDPCCKDPCCPTWEAQVDALFLWQGNIPSRPLYVDTVTQQSVLDVNQLQNRAAIAPRYAIIYNRDECRAIEANYFQVWGFNANQSVGPSLYLDPQTGNTVGAFQTNNLPVAFYDKIAAAQATGSAHIQSLEVNLRQRDGGMITWITGFRWVEWGQNLGINDVQYESVPDPLDPTAPPVVNTAADIFSVTTLNNLYGWQWGGDMMLWNSGRWLRINGVGKAGIYYNHQASQQTFYNNLNDPPVTVGASKDVVSFVGEAGVNCSWAVTNWLSWRAGYSFFWLSGVAVPANQLSITTIDAFAPETSTAAVNATSSVFIHGVTTGLEARW